MYEWDLFYSYKRDPQSDPWHVGVKDRLQFWLNEELDRDASIFMDTQAIHLGQQWPERLRDGVRRSRSILCVLSPRYFRSTWCYSEWKSFEARERMCNATLIAPTRFHDGDTFPQEAKNRQSRDISTYAVLTANFWISPLADDFAINCIKPLAKEIAGQIRQAPEFQADFPLVMASDADLHPAEHFKRPANV